MKSYYYKKFLIWIVKFGPALMALSCSLKIFLLSFGQEQLTRYINLALNLIILVGLYYQGKFFGLCWKHQSLCRLALWGYLFYLIFLGLDIKMTPFILGITTFYVLIVALILIGYERKGVNGGSDRDVPMQDSSRD